MGKYLINPSDPEFAKLWATGMPLNQMADIYLVSALTIKKTSQRGGLRQRRDHKIKVPNNDHFAKLWASTMTAAEIGDVFGVTKMTIGNAARRYGFPPRGTKRCERRYTPKAVPGLKPPKIRDSPMKLANWNDSQDRLIVATSGLYREMAKLADRWGRTVSEIQLRWHQVRAVR